MSEPSLDHDLARTRAEQLVTLFKAIAHPVRLGIVATLCGGEEHVGGLARRLGKRQVIVSQQLRILRGAAVVAVRRQGGRAVYRVQGAELEQFVRFAEGCASAVAAAAPRTHRSPPRRGPVTRTSRPRGRAQRRGRGGSRKPASGILRRVASRVRAESGGHV
jgi:ArsR family transcriptional regulator